MMRRAHTSERAGKIIRAVKRLTPASAQPVMARLFDRGTNLVEGITGLSTDLTPPLRIRLHIGPFLDPRLYRLSAERNLGAFRELCGLQPSAQFLDIGCGCGRIAAALSRYLGQSASYEGFDAARQPVEWCQHEITSRFPNFHFCTTDTFSQRYNPSGKTSASQLVFPFDDDRFDFAFAGSVYTHMLSDEVTNFIVETARVLRPGGINFATFCLLNEDSLPKVEAEKSSPRLPHKYGEFRVRDISDPASFIAQSETFIRNVYMKAGLNIIEPIRYGSWAGTPEKSELLDVYCFSQDIVIASKPNANGGAIQRVKTEPEG